MTYVVSATVQSLATAIAQMPSVSGGATLVVNRPVPLGAPQVIPGAVRLVFTRAGCVDFSATPGGLLALDSAPVAGAWTIFLNARSGQVVFRGRPAHVLPDWWGAVPGENQEEPVPLGNARAFQAAMDSLRLSGGEVRFAGKYWLAETLRVGTGITLAGMGASVSELVPGDAKTHRVPAVGIEVVDGASRVRLRDFQIGACTTETCPLMTQGPCQHDIRLTRGSDIAIDGVVVRRALGTGILQEPAVRWRKGYVNGRLLNLPVYEGVAGLRIANTSVLGCPTGIELQMASDVRLDILVVSWLPESGATWHTDTGIRLGKRGVPPCSDILIEDCDIAQWGRPLDSDDDPTVVPRAQAIQIRNVDGCRIVGCYFEPNYHFYADRHGQTPDDADYHPTIVFEADSAGPGGAEVGFNRLRRAWAIDGADGQRHAVSPVVLVEVSGVGTRSRVRITQSQGRDRAAGDLSPPTSVVGDPRDAERNIAISRGDFVGNQDSAVGGNFGWSCVDVRSDGMAWSWMTAGELSESQHPDWAILGVAD